MNNRLQFYEKVYYFYRSDVLSAQGLVHLPYCFFRAVLSEIGIPVFLTPVGYILLSSSHQWKNHSLSLPPVRIIHKRGPFTIQQKVPKILSLSSLLFTYSLCHCLNTCKILTLCLYQF